MFIYFCFKVKWVLGFSGWFYWVVDGSWEWFDDEVKNDGDSDGEGDDEKLVKVDNVKVK